MAEQTRGGEEDDLLYVDVMEWVFVLYWKRILQGGVVDKFMHQHDQNQEQSAKKVKYM